MLLRGLRKIGTVPDGSQIGSNRPRSPALARATTLATLASLLALSGASCPQFIQRYSQPLPRALPASPSLAQVMEVVNGNSARIVAFSTARGSISTAGFPSLRANLAYQREKDFRLRADTALTGPEVDLGSNQQEFWFWVRRAQPPALYYCAHDRYATSSARQIIPVDPLWLIEALGVVTFDPTWQHTGPASVGSGRIEIRSIQPSTATIEPVTRIVVLDETRGTVLEQHLYNSRSQRIATAKLSRHVHDPASGVTMPRRVEIEWPATQFALTIDLTDLQINQPGGDPRQLFTRPQYPGSNDIDLAGAELAPGMPPAGGAMPGGVMPGGPTPALGAPGGGSEATWRPATPVANGLPPGVVTAVPQGGSSAVNGAGAQAWQPASGGPYAAPGAAAPGYYPGGYPGSNPAAYSNVYPNAPPPSGASLAPTYVPAGSPTATLPDYATPQRRQ